MKKMKVSFLGDLALHWGLMGIGGLAGALPGRVMGNEGVASVGYLGGVATGFLLARRERGSKPTPLALEVLLVAGALATQVLALKAAFSPEATTGFAGYIGDSSISSAKAYGGALAGYVGDNVISSARAYGGVL